VFKIKYTGPIYNGSGYSQIKNYFLKLSKRNFQIQLNSIGKKECIDLECEKLENNIVEKPYIHITSGIAPQLRRDAEASYNIAYSMFETNCIPDNWIPFYNEFDEIWTPSSFCKKSFNIKDLKCITTIIPLGVDTELFSFRKTIERPFTFLANGKWVDRKGWDLLINAYTSEFIGNMDVRLCIKTDEVLKSKEEMIKEYLTSDRTAHMPRIMINNQKVNDVDIPLFYHEADVFVLPSRGEAFCLPFLESMACGVPVIAPDFGGHLDFVNKDNGWLIPIKKLTHLSERLCKINSAYKNLWFAEPEIKDVREIMRYVYENQNEIKEKSVKCREIAEQYSWDKITDKVENRLTEIWKVL
jgi:glycosyltransferase involved in cell wall biosynthesis